MVKSTAALDAYVMAALYPNRDMATKAFDMMESSGIQADQTIVDNFVTRMRLPNAKFAFMSTLLGLQNSKLTRSELKTISTPTMLIWGSNDQVIPIRLADNFVSTINPEKRHRFAAFPDAYCVPGHWFLKRITP